MLLAACHESDLASGCPAYFLAIKCAPGLIKFQAAILSVPVELLRSRLRQGSNNNAGCAKATTTMRATQEHCVCVVHLATSLVQCGTPSPRLPLRPAPHNLPPCTSSSAHPNFFLRSEEQREVLLCCRGTFSPEDAFVDLLATGVQRVCALSAGSTDCDEQLKPAPKDMISDLLATDTRIESEHWLIVGCDWS